MFVCEFCRARDPEGFDLGAVVCSGPQMLVHCPSGQCQAQGLFVAVEMGQAGGLITAEVKGSTQASCQDLFPAPFRPFAVLLELPHFPLCLSVQSPWLVALQTGDGEMRRSAIPSIGAFPK